MPWKRYSQEEQKLDLVRQMIAGKEAVSALCRRFGVSRQTAYKWLARYRCGRWRGLGEHSRRPQRAGRQTASRWLRRLRSWRNRHPTWGARKLRYALGQRFGWAGVPAVATLNRWLRRWGLTQGRRRRRPGPTVIVATPPAPRRSHEVWTVDFKGWYRTGNGTRVDPLTVRDLYSRYGLCVTLLRGQTIGQTQPIFRRLFARYGPPALIRCDNGAPFGGAGPTGLTRLSAWWVKLGIKVEFITPGRPGENGAHEQFHRVYQAEVAAQPARTRRAQQLRTNCWLEHYNRHRPHEALAMRCPAERLRRNHRHLPRLLRSWSYPDGWERCWVKGNGEISHRGVRRYVGEAFVHDYVGLRQQRPTGWRVYFGPVLIGELRAEESGSIRMARYRRAP